MIGQIKVRQRRISTGPLGDAPWHGPGEGDYPLSEGPKTLLLDNDIITQFVLELVNHHIHCFFRGQVAGFNRLNAQIVSL